MHVIVGLGNPGEKYKKTRHNIGFLSVDILYKDYAFSAWQQKFQSHIAQGVIAGKKILLVKPQCFMNLSGQAVGEVLRYYKLSIENLSVIHDDLDLPFTRVKVKTGGGHGGHNGLRSIDAHCGINYQRLRIGIGRPVEKNLVSNYVLHDFSAVEWGELQDFLQDMAKAFPKFLEGDMGQFIQGLARFDQNGKE